VIGAASPFVRELVIGFELRRRTATRRAHRDAVLMPITAFTWVAAESCSMRDWRAACGGVPGRKSLYSNSRWDARSGRGLPNRVDFIAMKLCVGRTPGSAKTDTTRWRNNCEHFCEWSVRGVPCSEQVEQWVARPRSALQQMVRWVAKLRAAFQWGSAFWGRGSLV
jgi:hypothetical protein